MNYLLLVLLIIFFICINDFFTHGNSIFMSKFEKNDVPDEYRYKDSRRPIYFDFIPEVPPM